MNRNGAFASARLVARAQAGWTFVETIVVIAIIVILTGSVAFSAVRYIDRARAASARLQIENLRTALAAYYLDTGGYPTDSQGLAALWSQPVLPPIPTAWAGPYVDRPPGSDPWGRSFVYRAPSPGGIDFEIVSYGSDGLPGGVGSEVDVSSAE